MNGLTPKSKQGFQPAIFDKIEATLPGGATFDAEGFNAPDKQIPAGTLVAIDKDSGLAKAVTIDADSKELSAAPIGLVAQTVRIDNNPLVSVVIAGTVKKAALSKALQDNIDAVAKALPRITFY